MTASLIQLIGGKFQDGQGNLLANGYLKMVLNQDATIAGVGSICSGIEITIKLNSSASVDTSTAQYVWGNDAMLPLNSYYTVTGYSAAGQPCWGPNIQQVVGSGTFDCGTWIPNQIYSWTPSPTSVILEVNGTLASSQALQNLTAGANITITDEGGGEIEIAAAGASALTVGSFIGPGFPTPFPFYGGTNTSGPMSTTPDQISFFQFTLPFAITISRVTVYIATDAAGGTVNFGIYDSTGAKLLDSGAINATSLGSSYNNITPVTLAPGTYYFAQSANSTTVRVPVATGYEAVLTDMLNAKNVKIGQAQNPTSAGVMPATLGTLTADSLYLYPGSALFEA
jgi:hypothetical protein